MTPVVPTKHSPAELRSKIRDSLERCNQSVMPAGVFWAVLTGAAIPLLATYLGMNNRWFGLLMALPLAMVPMQLLGAWLLMRGGNRKFLTLVTGGLFRITWFAVALLPLVLEPGWFSSLLLIVLVAFAHSCQQICALIWQSWMADLIPARRRGTFFGKRLRLFSVFLLFTTLLQGWFLPASGMSGTGWMIALVIVIAAIAGLVELSFYAFMYEPPLRQLTPKPGQNGLAQFLAPLKEKKFFPFLLLIFFIMASTSAVAPFLWRHFLDVVQLSPLKASLILQATPLLATFLFGRLWGRWIDRHGIKPAIAIGVSGGTLAMLCWPFISPQFWWVGLFVGFMGSVFWLAVDISFMNGLMRFTSLAGGHRYATLYNFFAASGGALAGVMAGEIAQQLVATQWVAELRSTLLTYHIQFSPYVVLILIGALIRFFAVAVVLPRLEHDKPVKSFQAVRMFHTQIYYAIAGSISMPVRMVRSRIKL